MDRIDMVVTGLRDLQAEMLSRLREEEAQDSPKRLLTAGYVVGMIESEIRKLTEIPEENRQGVENILSMLLGRAEKRHA